MLIRLFSKYLQSLIVQAGCVLNDDCPKLSSCFRYKLIQENIVFNYIHVSSGLQSERGGAIVGGRRVGHSDADVQGGAGCYDHEDGRTGIP